MTSSPAPSTEDRLHRNFMGYTVMPATDQIGVGVTSIGDVAGSYAANNKKLAGLQTQHRRRPAPGRPGRHSNRGGRPPQGGDPPHHLHVAAGFRVGRRSVRDDPNEHFADALAQLRPMVEDGLVDIDADGLTVTPGGRFFLRNVCMPFDAYLGDKRPDGPKYSRTV